MKNLKAYRFLKIAGITIILFLCLIPTTAYSVVNMADYCYLPPFVTDPNTPPNIFLVFDRTAFGKNRAYQGEYNSSTIYQGFFDPMGKYTYDPSLTPDPGFKKVTDAQCTAFLTSSGTCANLTINGTCTGMVGSGTCSGSTGTCSGYGTGTCSGGTCLSNTCSGGTCRLTGGVCTNNSQCANMKRCSNNLTASCNNDGDCASPKYCTNGGNGGAACTLSSQCTIMGTCSNNSAACDDNSDCTVTGTCSNDASISCTDDSPCAGGSGTCSNDASISCTDDSPCALTRKSCSTTAFVPAPPAAACTNNSDCATALNCFPGNLLNFALMSTLDLSRQAFIGFGYTPISSSPGDVYTYTGSLLSYGASNAATVSGSTYGVCGLSFSGGTYSYYFSIGNDGTGSTKASPVTIRVRNDATCPTSSTGTVAVNSGDIIVDMDTGDSRTGLLQKYSDSNKDYKDDYPNAGARFGVKRWKTGGGNDKSTEIIDDGATITDLNRADYFESLLNTISSSPTEDPGTNSLGSMMHDLYNYFHKNSSYKETSSDGNDFTQSPYDWYRDSAPGCRKNFVVFVTPGQDLIDDTTGGALGGDTNATCSKALDTNNGKSDLSQNACYAYKDLGSTCSGGVCSNNASVTCTADTTCKHPIMTYIVHTLSGVKCSAKCTSGLCNDNTTACTVDSDCSGTCNNNSAVTCATAVDCTNENKLRYAASKGGGEYIKVEDPTKLKTKIEEAILNILSTSASASTVATLTTQTRESSTLTQAYFYPRKENTPLRWIGYLRLLWSDNGANLREDTANRGWLDLKKDKIMTFYYDSDTVSYRAKTFADAEGDLEIDACGTYTAKSSDDVVAIWNAQSKLQSRTPLETDSDARDIKIGIDSLSGVNKNSIVRNEESEMYSFKKSTTVSGTALGDVLKTYWNTGSFCSNNTSRYCAADADCNACSDSTTPSLSSANIASLNSRGCSAASDCSYCTAKVNTSCSSDDDCKLPDYGVCSTSGGLVCSGDPAGSCAAKIVDDACGSGFTCNDGSSASCSVLGAACGSGTGTCIASLCKYKCSIDTTHSCSTDTECKVTYGPCITTSTAGHTLACSSGGTCTPDCDKNCADSVISYVRGYDRPTPSGSLFRIRHQCTADTDCPSGQTCNTTDSLCTGADVTKTLKLGDIVYSTPRISPNSAVNGYDVTYTDSSYANFVTRKMKGTCPLNSSSFINRDNFCLTGETCSDDGICSGDGYTPLVLVGANDGMVHAFKVSKIKDISPSATACFGADCKDADGTTDITAGTQTARFADYPHSVKTDTNPSGSDTAPPSDMGKEMWAYIPYNVIPFLRWYCTEGYCHVPMVDARFTVVDASIDYDHSGTVTTAETRSATDLRCTGSDNTCDCLPFGSDGKCNYPWRRLLIGAMGIGGKQVTLGSNKFSSSLFVIDITEPTTPKLIWERTLPDGTLTTSTPAVIVRLGADDANGQWYIVLGSGAQNATTDKLNYKKVCNTTKTKLCTVNTDCPSGETCVDNISEGRTKIFAFDLRTGANLITGTDGVDGTADDGIDIGASGVAVGDLMAVDMNGDYQVDDIYFGTYGGTGASQTGKFYRLRLNNNGTYLTTPSDWVLSTVVDTGRPMYAAPEIAKDALGNIWLYFGTGVYLALEHGGITAQCSNNANLSCTSDADCGAGNTCSAISGYLEYIYGLKESEACWKGSGTCNTYTKFLDTTNLIFSGAKAVQLGCFCAGSLLSTINCASDGTCPSTCTSPEDTVVLKVTNSTLSGYSGTGTSCNGQIDEAAITCLATRINSDGCSGTACDGWKRAILGQKTFSKPFVAGGLVDFTSFQPTKTSCSLGGNTHLIGLNYNTGSSYVQPTIFMSGGTSGSTTNLKISSSVNLGTGVPPLGESLVALPLAGDTYKVITQVSGGLPGTSMSPSLPAKGGYVLWLVK